MTELIAVSSRVKRLVCEVCAGEFDYPAGARGPNPRKCPDPGCQLVKLSDRRSSNGKRRARMTGVELRDDILRERLGPLWEDDGAQVVLDEAVRACVEAGGRQGCDRADIQREVVGLARAVGQSGNYEQAIRLAAVAISFAARIRPVSGGQARPDYERLLEAA